ncbi:MAG TPA: hypothetical protein VNK26_03410 [Pyrinomonadaceae bacterium]|nr:hypothetical protein [Pyrinomonadaceae bacterium]
MFAAIGRDGFIYVSDGNNSVVRKIDQNGSVIKIIKQFDTPSGLALGHDNKIYVADAGDNTIKAINPDDSVSVIAGNGTAGFTDGKAAEASFRGPVGIAADNSNRLYVADTYNDAIRVIENGLVRTIAGGTRGLSDGQGLNARFDTPVSLALFNNRILVIDYGNRSIRQIDENNFVTTLAVNKSNSGVSEIPLINSLHQPTSIAVYQDKVIFIGDGTAIYSLGGRVFPYLETVPIRETTSINGGLSGARFRSISFIQVLPDGDLLIADKGNRAVRRITSSEAAGLGPDSNKASEEDLKKLSAGRWPFDPSDSPRDIAGTVGEIRGELIDRHSWVGFHNALDIPGYLGETVRFIRDEKVLDLSAVKNFGSLNETLRLPLTGYTHLNIGRDDKNKPYNDKRLIFENDENGNPIFLRIPRGTKFAAGEPVGTLNRMNHVHLISGPAGLEFNGLKVLALPGLKDTVSPKITELIVKKLSENGNLIESETCNSDCRIKVSGDEKIQVVVGAFDRMDSNPERRRLGVYRVGYSFSPLNNASKPGEKETEIFWSLTFDRCPPPEAVDYVYDAGSRAEATGNTIFRYIATNYLDSKYYGKGQISVSELKTQETLLTIYVEDFFGNRTTRKVIIEKGN